MSQYKKCFIVCGHGGNGDPGAVAADGTTERSIIQGICRHILSELGVQSIGVGVNNELTIKQKTAVINSQCAKYGFNYKNSLLLSVHADFRGASEGVGCYHYAGSVKSEKFAEYINFEVAKVGDRKIKYNKPDTSSRFGRIGIVRDSDPLAILLEVGSLRADSDLTDGLELLKSEGGQKQIAKFAADGVRKFAGWDIPEGEGIPQDAIGKTESDTNKKETTIESSLLSILSSQKIIYSNSQGGEKGDKVRSSAAYTGVLVREVQGKIGLPISE